MDREELKAVGLRDVARFSDVKRIAMEVEVLKAQVKALAVANVAKANGLLREDDVPVEYQSYFVVKDKCGYWWSIDCLDAEYGMIAPEDIPDEAAPYALEVINNYMHLKNCLEGYDDEDIFFFELALTAQPTPEQLQHYYTAVADGRDCFIPPESEYFFATGYVDGVVPEGEYGLITFDTEDSTPPIL